jgi:hypothetical protein
MTKTRRDFIKKTVTAAAALPILGSTTSVFANPLNNKASFADLSNKELLRIFDEWVSEYVEAIKSEKQLAREFKDNKALVDLPGKMEEMMPIFKERFSDDHFMKEYLKISRKLSKEIDPSF